MSIFSSEPVVGDAGGTIIAKSAKDGLTAEQILGFVCATPDVRVRRRSVQSTHQNHKPVNAQRYCFWKALDDEPVSGASVSVLPVLPDGHAERRGPSRRCGD